MKDELWRRKLLLDTLIAMRNLNLSGAGHIYDLKIKEISEKLINDLNMFKDKM